jgi:uncharacterized membrane protein YhaH (DUF805 family)
MTSEPRLERGMSWYFEVLRKYAVFTGRARRKEYWYYGLFAWIILGVLAAIGRMWGTHGGYIYGLFDLYLLATFIPNLAVGTRRLHDIDRSGWWLLLGLVPVVGGIILLIFALQDSQPGANQYGPNPKDLSLSGASPTELV